MNGVESVGSVCVEGTCIRLQVEEAVSTASSTLDLALMHVRAGGAGGQHGIAGACAEVVGAKVWMLRCGVTVWAPRTCPYIQAHHNATTPLFPAPLASLA